MIKFRIFGLAMAILGVMLGGWAVQAAAAGEPAILPTVLAALCAMTVAGVFVATRWSGKPPGSEY